MDEQAHAEVKPQGSPPRFVPTLLLVLLVSLVFVRGLFFGFVEWDDDRNILLNPQYRVTTPSTFAYFLTRAHNDQYMPLTWNTWALCAEAGRYPEPRPRPGGAPEPFAPLPFHLLGLACHILSAVLVYALLRRLLARDDWAPWLGAALWAVHPLQTEAAVWVNGGNITLAYCCGLGGILLWWDAAKAQAAGDKSGFLRRFIAATLFFVGALLAKPTAAGIPLVLLVLEAGFLKRPVKQVAPLIGLWGVLAIGVILVNWLGSAGSQAVHTALWQRPLIAGDALAFYLWKTLLPINLAMNYGRTPEAIFISGFGWYLWLVPVGVTALLWWLRRRELWIGWGIFVAALLPTIGLVPFYYQHLSTVADRYTYLALLGPAYLVAWLLTQASGQGRKVTVGLAAAFLLGCIALSVRQAETWRDNITLFENAVRVSPRSRIAQYNLATCLQGLGRGRDAIPHFRAAVDITPDYVDARTNLGICLLQTGDPADSAEAIRQWEEAVRLAPDHPVAHYYLGMAAAQRGDTAGAITHWRRILKSQPQDFAARYNITIALEQSGNRDAAREEANELARRFPDHPQVRVLLQRLKLHE